MTATYAGHLNPCRPDTVRVAGSVVVLLHSPARDLAVGGRPPDNRNVTKTKIWVKRSDKDIGSVMMIAGG